MVQRLGVDPSRSGRTRGLRPRRGPSPSNAARSGTRCRLSACDIRFVGPTLFTSELTGHQLATTSGNDPLSPSRQLGCDTCRISGQIGCRPAARTQRVRINSPVPTPGGTVGKKRIWSGVRESNPPHLLGRQRPKAARPTPLSKKSRALCIALRLPVSMRRIVACAGLWAGVFGWNRERGSSLSFACLPPALRRRQGQSELDTFNSGQNLAE